MVGLRSQTHHLGCTEATEEESDEGNLLELLGFCIWRQNTPIHHTPICPRWGRGDSPKGNQGVFKKRILDSQSEHTKNPQMSTPSVKPKLKSLVIQNKRRKDQDPPSLKAQRVGIENTAILSPLPGGVGRCFIPSWGNLDDNFPMQQRSPNKLSCLIKTNWRTIPCYSYLIQRLMECIPSEDIIVRGKLDNAQL